MNHLLEDPIFHVTTSGGEQSASLPHLLALLAKGEVVCLTRLRRHQSAPVRVFLATLAAAAMVRLGVDTLPLQAEPWRQGLLALAEGDEQAWQLVVEDVTQPAFLQPALASKALFAKAEIKANHPDKLDVLITAKNHDLKISRMAQAVAEDWVYALISLQTMTGYLGRNYGIVRMNSKTGSRALVSGTRSGRWDGQWREEVQGMLAERQAMLDLPLGYRQDGVVLTWKVPWDLDSSLPLQDLDPFFIECARSVRLRVGENALQVWGVTSKGRRIAGPDNGDVGDPWTALNMADAKKGQSALTIGRDGVTPECLRDVLFGQEVRRSPLLERISSTGQGDLKLTISVLVTFGGTKAKTVGYYDVALAIPPKAQRRLFSRVTSSVEGAFSKKMVEFAGAMQNKVLRPALYVLLEGGRDSADSNKRKVFKREASKWVDQIAKQFRLGWWERYFEMLWLRLEEDQPEEQVLQAWVDMLNKHAKDIFDHSLQRAPVFSSRRWRAVAEAKNLYEQALKEQFTDYLPREVGRDQSV